MERVEGKEKRMRRLRKKEDEEGEWDIQYDNLVVNQQNTHILQC